MAYQPRFTPRFSNGFWKVFDNHYYSSNTVCLSWAEAIYDAARRNTGRNA